MDFILSWKQVFPKGAYLVAIRERYEYKDKKRTDKQLGLTYVVVNRRGYDKVNIKVDSMEPILSNEEIEASEDDITVVAEGFEGNLYNKDGVIMVSGKAEKVVLV